MTAIVSSSAVMAGEGHGGHSLGVTDSAPILAEKDGRAVDGPPGPASVTPSPAPRHRSVKPAAAGPPSASSPLVSKRSEQTPGSHSHSDAPTAPRTSLTGVKKGAWQSPPNTLEHEYSTLSEMRYSACHMCVVTVDDVPTSTAAPDTVSHLYLLCLGPDSHTAWPEKHFNCY